MPPNKLAPVCVCATADNDLNDDMTRQKHVYETAFDCRISKSDDDLDNIDKISNHPVLFQENLEKSDQYILPSVESRTSEEQSSSKATFVCPVSDTECNISLLSENLQSMHLPVEETSTNLRTSPLRVYTPSPPSTAPLPTKFHGKEQGMNSVRSAPNLPHQRARFKDTPLSRKLVRARSPTSGSGSIHTQDRPFDMEFGNHQELISAFRRRVRQSRQPSSRVMEIKDRPRKELLMPNYVKEGSCNVLQFKGRRRRNKYSSTESMTTSSSGGSMESIKSSTSEGNRSTTSTESYHSSSLSSHSSDSGANATYPATKTSAFLTHCNKLHMLSPISDKSSQEPTSDMSDNNRNNNSHKYLSEEVSTPDTTKRRQRRLPQNRNVLNLGFHISGKEIQGSDSGISIQSREGIKSKFELAVADLSAPSRQDFNDLPFDIPDRLKLNNQDACTSSSATSVDLKDLPFDMPKLRRRLRTQPSKMESSVSQASSSQSVHESNTQAPGFRSQLTLDLQKVELRQRTSLLMPAAMEMGFNFHKPDSIGKEELIDINVPLEKQGWFHGAITRVEAENVLRLLREGSFLVRNSESTKQDYSLSLKSARGYMHIRIQRDSVDGSFILGQFTKPFSSVSAMIKHFTVNRLPIKGAEHMCLVQPVIAQLL